MGKYPDYIYYRVAGWKTATFGWRAGKQRLKTKANMNFDECPPTPLRSQTGITFGTNGWLLGRIKVPRGYFGTRVISHLPGTVIAHGGAPVGPLVTPNGRMRAR